MRKAFFVAFILGISLTAACIVYVPVPPEGGRYPGGERDYGWRSDDFVDSRDVSYFYDYLAPYGFWIDHPRFGYVWIPNIDRYGWRPYTYGRWVWTDHGWTWVSSYRWGWAPFHYGRWAWEPGLGWFWVPDTMWGPAWVAWRWSDLYIGWAPLPPDIIFVPGRGIVFLPYDLPASFWIFVGGPYFFNSRLDRHILPPERNTTIINFTSVAAKIVVADDRITNQGLDVDRISRITGQGITRYQLRDAGQPGESSIRGQQIDIYRPEIRKNDAARPRKVMDRDQAADSIVRSRLSGYQEMSPEVSEGTLEVYQRDEQEILEETQKDEVIDMKTRMEKEVKETGDQTEKTRVESRYTEKIRDLNQKHQEEKASLDKRHAEEKAQVKKKKEEKKEEKKDKESRSSSI